MLTSFAMKKNHHFISETYLQSFSDQDGKVHMYRKDDPEKVIRQVPKELAKHKHFYRQPKPDGGFDSDRIEDFFSSIEGHWPEIVGRLTQRENVNDKLTELFQFVAIHRARVPAARDASERMLAAMVKSTGRLLDRQGKLPPLPDSMKRFEDIWNHIEVSIDPHMSIHAMEPVIRGVGEVISLIGIGALHNATEVPFLTSDNPVIWFDGSALEDEVRPYTIDRDGPVVLLFPISPKIMLYGCSSLKEQFGYEGLCYGELTDQATVHRMNSLICKFAYEAVFASAGIFIELVKVHAEISPVVVTDQIQTEHGEALVFRQAWGKRAKKPAWRPQQ